MPVLYFWMGSHADVMVPLSRIFGGAWAFLLNHVFGCQCFAPLLFLLISFQLWQFDMMHAHVGSWPTGTCPQHPQICRTWTCLVPDVGDERHLVFECPALQHIRQHYADIYSDARSTMRLFMWHKDQKAVASCLLRLLSQCDSLLGWTWYASHQPCWRCVDEIDTFNSVAMLVPDEYGSMWPPRLFVPCMVLTADMDLCIICQRVWSCDFESESAWCRPWIRPHRPC